MILSVREVHAKQPTGYLTGIESTSDHSARPIELRDLLIIIKIKRLTGSLNLFLTTKFKLHAPKYPDQQGKLKIPYKFNCILSLTSPATFTLVRFTIHVEKDKEIPCPDP